MKTSFKHIVLLCALVLPTPFVAQEQEIEIVETTNALKQDFAPRIGFDIGGDLYHGLSLKWEEEARFKDISTTFDRLYSTLSLTYKFNTYFKTTIGY